MQGKSYPPIKDFTWSTDLNNVEIGCCLERTSSTPMKVVGTMPAEQLVFSLNGIETASIKAVTLVKYFLN